ncbi:MAG TPA: M56 family metallopeptidase [Anaerovoracaceae bacterium]|nr:M56 family metallopeptidase [Anaerovoracaceae bacterium]
MRAERERVSEMQDLFLAVLNMSVTAALAALVIILLRGSLGRVLPRTFSCALWVIVLYRMICPFSFSSIFSTLGRIRQGLDTYTSTLKVASLKDALKFEVLSGQGAQGLGLEPYRQGVLAETSDGSVIMNISAVSTPADYFIMAVTVLWLLGIFALLFYNAVSYWRLCRSVDTATLFEDHELVEECRAALRMGRKAGVYESDKAESPFVYGIFRPRVLLPASAAHPVDEQERERLRHILLHELHHIKRFDYLVKPLAFLFLCVHWFNPVLWIAFRLFDRDMELSCDEGVVKALKTGTGGDYAATLLNMASARSGIGKNCALAFHETNVGARVKHIVKYKKPGPAAGVITAILLILCAVSLLSSPASLAEEPEGGQANVLVMCNAEGSDYPDTILLLGYNGDKKEVNLVFLPRDLAVISAAEAVENSEGIKKLPLYTEEKRHIYEEMLENAALSHNPRKLFAYAAGNPPEAVTGKLSEILGVEIHNFVKLDTGVFRDLVDAVGGVEFDVPMRMVYADPYATPPLDIDLEKGRQVLDGERAEMLVRFRKGYAEGDLARIEVEKAFLAAMIEQKSGINIGSFHEIYQALSGRVETDLDMKGAKNLITLFLTGETAAFVDLPVVQASDDSRSLLLLTQEAKETLKEKF